MTRKFQKKKLWPLMKQHFLNPSDLVNTKTTIPLRVGEERWIYTEKRIFTFPSGDSCVIFSCDVFGSPSSSRTE